MHNYVDNPEFWDDKYNNSGDKWDLGTPVPVFMSLLNEKRWIKEGMSLLVSGCGKGYDAIAAAKEGLIVTAVDFSEEAIKAAQKNARDENLSVNFLQEDFFLLDENYNGSFDLVFEYTTFCAINPERRGEYAEKMSLLLKPGGRLIAIVFPIDNRPGGPPFSIDMKEFYTLFSRHLKLEYFSREINSVKPRKGKEVLMIFIRQ